MRTFLLTWNPKAWDWKDLAREAARSATGRRVHAQWSTGNRRDIKKGDRLFLLRQGVEPRGIMAAGWATRASFPEGHWDAERYRQGLQANYVELRFDTLLDPNTDPPLSTARLTAGHLADVAWRTQSSGILIVPEAAVELETAWAAHTRQSVAIADEIAGLEGARRQRLVAHRSRERALREAKLSAFKRDNGGRLACEVPGCGFDFAAVYGSVGEGYAQVHHLDALGDRPGASRTSLSRLAVVCANCHAMIHVGGKNRPLGRLIPHRTSKRGRPRD